MKECSSCHHCFTYDCRACPVTGCENYGGPLRFDPVLESPLIEGRYEIKKRLGQGGMGIVYQARHILLKSQHAIKIILPDVVGRDKSLPGRFHQEAVAAAAIRHQNIVGVTDFGFVEEKPFLVMEYIEGISLSDLLLQERRFTPEKALAFMEPVVAGVAAAHHKSVVHRDLKPMNIMVSDGLPWRDGVKILDFGLAKIKPGNCWVHWPPC